MRKLLLIAALSSIYFIFGCSDTNQLAGPDNRSRVVEQSTSLNSVNWISLPRPFHKSLRKSWSTGKFIKIGGSGSITIQDQYEGGLHGLVTVEASISFSPGSIDENISYYDGINYLKDTTGTELWTTFSIGDETCTADFGPHIMFAAPAVLNFKFTGVDLTGMDPDNIRFVYYNAETGELSDTGGTPIIDVESGTLQIVNAVIPHFSRFGWFN